MVTMIIIEWEKRGFICLGERGEVLVDRLIAGSTDNQMEYSN